MRRLGLFAVGIMVLVCLGSCRTKHIKVRVIDVPGLKNQACATIIENALHKHPSVVSVRPDFINRQVTVTFNSMVIALKNIEFIIADVGFDANDTEASPTAVAKLPPECR